MLALEEERRTTWRNPLLLSIESQMLLRETIHKTKVLFNKNLRKLRCLFHGGYQKLPRSLSFDTLLCGRGNARTHTSDQFYNEFYDHLQYDLSRMQRFCNNSNNISNSNSNEPEIEDTVSSARQSLQKSYHGNVPKEKKNNNKGNSSQVGKKEDSNSNKRASVLHLAQKMREIDMVDEGDLEDVLDIEEALHYYSRLKSPVYLDIVDQFFMDMHSELSVPQPSFHTQRYLDHNRFLNAV
ncbi:hypothetical protein PIB30_031464 [Stylosanthes scabra]|uniref:Uncharacterized protein n=1 Tax=Stylosanthes scabra TaxID=79078 RepID=A0ABU6UAN3_9FABA|nr:hypothetical protein [Stylosanthes scabra]